MSFGGGKTSVFNSKSKYIAWWNTLVGVKDFVVLVYSVLLRKYRFLQTSAFGVAATGTPHSLMMGTRKRALVNVSAYFDPTSQSSASRE